jgi:hypothetical protein
VQPPIGATIPLSHKTNPAEGYLFPLWLSLDYPGMQEAFGLESLLRASDGLPISMVADGNDAQQHVAANILTVGGDDYYIFDQGNDTENPIKLDLPLASLTAKLTLETNKRVGIGPLGAEVL